MRTRSLLLPTATLLFPALLLGESCITQSRLSAADRTAISQSAQSIATAVQSNDPAALRAAADLDIQKNFGELQYLVAVTSPKLSGGPPVVEQIYLLDGSTLQPGPAGSPPEAQFFCSLNNSASEADFVIPSLPPGKYAFVMVRVPSHPVPWRLSMLLVQQNNRWLLAGFYPKPLELAGHDGLWYWTQAREYVNQKQLWNAWLFYQEAMNLLRPADFVLSTHLDKLHTEETGATPPALTDGISPQTPLVLKLNDGTSPTLQGRTGAVKRPSAATTPQNSGQDGANQTPQPSTDLRFTSLSLGQPPAASTEPSLEATFEAPPLSDPEAARQRNLNAARTLLNDYPELRKPYSEIAITAQSAGQPPLTTTLPISQVP